MSDNESECKGKEVFSDKVHKLIVSESRVRGSDSEENDG